MKKVTREPSEENTQSITRSSDGKSCEGCGSAMSRFASQPCGACRKLTRNEQTEPTTTSVENAEKVKMTSVTRRGLGMVRSFLIDAADDSKAPLYTVLGRLPKIAAKEFNQALAWLEQNEVPYKS